MSEEIIARPLIIHELIEKNLVGVPSITEPMPEGFGMYAR